MILEVAILDIKPNQESAFERDFVLASKFISSIEGYLSHELLRCLEKSNRYILLARWETLEAHTEVFRKAPAYQEWKRLLHHYYDPFPTVEHYSRVFEKLSQSCADEKSFCQEKPGLKGGTRPPDGFSRRALGKPVRRPGST